MNTHWLVLFHEWVMTLGDGKHAVIYWLRTHWNATYVGSPFIFVWPFFSPTKVTWDDLSHTGVCIDAATCKTFSGALFICSELGESSPSLLLFHLPPAASTFFCPLIKRSALTRGLSFGVYHLCRGRLCRQIQRRDGSILWVDTDLLLQLEWNASLICWAGLLPLILAPGGTVNTSDKKCHN